jgi:hypothetical protein
MSVSFVSNRFHLNNISEFTYKPTAACLKKNKLTVVALLALSCIFLAYENREFLKKKVNYVIADVIEICFFNDKKNIVSGEMSLKDKRALLKELFDFEFSGGFRKKFLTKKSKEYILFFTFSYAQMCHKGEGRGKNLFDARACYKKVLESNGEGIGENSLLWSRLCYAEMCYLGRGGPLELPKARELYGELCKLDIRNIPGSYMEKFIPALFVYPLMLNRGVGGFQNLPEARKLFGKMSKVDPQTVSRMHLLFYLRAKFEYAVMCYNGEGGARNLVEARKTLEDLARANLRDLSPTSTDFCEEARVKYLEMFHNKEGLV